MPQDWIFEDEGVSGAVLVRPALEAVRDLAAQGQIEAVLVHSPDRLSRKYAYLLRSGSKRTTLRGPFVHRADQAVFHHPG